MGEFPKDGSTFVVESIDRTAYRWAKYKPDGARQMGKPGRWQKQVWSGDCFKWENCEEPVGEIAPAMEDGLISGAVKALAAKDAEIAQLNDRILRLQDRITWYREGFREMSKWPPEVASERTAQYALDTLTGPTEGALVEIRMAKEARAALKEQANV